MIFQRRQKGDSSIGCKCSSIQRRISIAFRNPAHQLSANILDRSLWRYLYLPSVSRLFFLYIKIIISFSDSFTKINSSPLHVFTSKASRHSCNPCRLLGSLGNIFLLLLYTVLCMFFKSVGSKIASGVFLTNSFLISLDDMIWYDVLFENSKRQ